MAGTATSPDIDLELVGEAEARKALGGICRTTLWQYVRSGRLVASKIGGRLRFHPDDLKHFARVTARVQPAQPPKRRGRPRKGAQS
jgi:hypothetical protein